MHHQGALSAHFAAVKPAENKSMKTNDDVATSIKQRANALNISISELCRTAKVSRRWFEYLKKRTPKAVEAYIKIEQQLNSLEQTNIAQNK